MEKKFWDIVKDWVLQNLTVKFLARFLLFFLATIIGLLITSYVTGEEINTGILGPISVGSQDSIPPWVTGYIVDQTNIEFWEEFSGELRYFDPPFSQIDRDHKEFKRKFISKKHSLFLVLLFRGNDTLQYRKKLSGLLETLAWIHEHTALNEWRRIKGKIEVKVVCNTENRRTFFLGNQDDKDVSLVYHYDSDNSRSQEIEFSYLVDGHGDRQRIFNDYWGPASNLEIFDLLEQFEENNDRLSIYDCPN